MIRITNMRYKYLLFLLATVLSAMHTNAGAQNVTESRTLQKSFEAREGMSLDITNKYGKVHLSPSKNDSVYIRIELNASASNKQKLRKLVDGVSFNLAASNHYIIAETKFSSGPANLIESIRTLTNNLISSGSRLVVDYYVAAPEFMVINLDNRYGDIYIESTDADLNISASNGVIKGEDLWGNNKFDLNFCNISIGSVKQAQVKISYGELNIERGDMVDIRSSSSKIELGDIESLVSDSRRDRFFIKKVSSIEGSAYFTDYTIDLLSEKLNLNTRYGKLRVEQIPYIFKLISVESTYTDIYLTADNETAFELDARLTSCYSSIPEEWVIEETTLSAERDEYLYSGQVGSSPKSKIILKMTRGNLDFMQN
jgi:hypothetical protein